MPPDAPVSPWFNVMGTVFIVLGCGAIWLGRRYWTLAIASKSWPSVPGKVLRSFVQQSESTDQQGGSVTVYHARVEYEYVAEGQRLEGKRIQFGGPAGTGILAKAQAIVDRYPVGATVDVFYDRMNLSLCTLDRTISKVGIGLMLGMGLFFIIVGAAMLVMINLA